MVDTIRTLAELQALLATNTTGAIASQDLRDFLITALPTGRTATRVVASSQAHERQKAQADRICDGVADQEQIQQLITELSNVGGGTLICSEGDFRISATITGANNIQIIGQGNATRFIAETNLNNPIFDIVGFARFHLFDFQVHGNSANQSTPATCIVFNSCDSSSICRVHATDSSLDGIKLINNSTRCIVFDCESDNNDAFGILSQNSQNCWVCFNDSYNNAKTNIAHDNCQGFIIEVNQSHDSLEDGIAVDLASEKCSVGYNIVYSNAHFGISLDDGQGGIIGNEVYLNGWDGIRVAATSLVRISANGLHNNGQETNNTYSEILLETTSVRNIVTANAIRIDGATKSAHAISEDTIADDFNIITHNIVEGTAATSNFDFNGANSVTTPNIG